MKQTIRVYTRELSMKDDSKKKFVTHSYTKDGVKFYQVKFGLTAIASPKTKGYWLVELEKETCSIQPSKIDGRNDILWIHDVYSVVKDEEYEKELEERRQRQLDDVF